MTPTQRKAMQDALEALTKSVQFCNHMGTGDWQPTAMACHGAIAALRNTLAEPAPVPLLTDDEKKHPFILWGEYETKIEALQNEVEFHKALSAKALQSPPVTSEITRLRSIISDMELAPPVPLLTYEEVAAEASRHWAEDGVDPIEFAQAIEALVRQKAGL